MSSKDQRSRTFRVLRRTSTRRAPRSEQWLNYLPGQTVREAKVPKHAPVDEWVASGHWQEVKE